MKIWMEKKKSKISYDFFFVHAIASKHSQEMYFSMGT